MNFLREFKDECIMFFGIGLAYALATSLKLFDVYGLWGSLLSIVLTAFYFSYSFFKSNKPGKKLVYFLIFTGLTIGYFSLVYFAYGIIDSTNDEVVSGNWLNAIYFSVVTWTTLGYGDFRPIDELKIWVMVEALMGYIFMGLLVGKVLFLAQRSGSESAT